MLQLPIHELTKNENANVSWLNCQLEASSSSSVLTFCKKYSPSFFFGWKIKKKTLLDMHLWNSCMLPCQDFLFSITFLHQTA